MASGRIIRLKKFFSGLRLFPETLTRAIYDDYGNRLDSMLDRTPVMDDPSDEEAYTGIDLVDSDTLGGKYSADDFTTLLRVGTATFKIGVLEPNKEVLDVSQRVNTADDYSIIGIVGYSLIGSSYTKLKITRLEWDNGSVYYSVRNQSNSVATGDISIRVRFLLIKNKFK